VGVTRGRILDVAVDLRRGSPTFGRSVTALLDDEQLHQLWVPPGFGHGFLVVSEVADVVYKVDHPYTPAADRGVSWNDPTLAIDWTAGGAIEPIEPLLSERDAALPTLESAEIDFVHGEG